jgi:hypothetical protein
MNKSSKKNLENGIPYNYLRDILKADKKSKTGLIWKQRENSGNFNALFSGKDAGFLQMFGSNAIKYYMVKVAYKGKSVNIPAHRIVAILSGKQIAGKVVRHKDQNSLNNVMANIEVCTQSEFLANRSKQKNNHSGYKNVVKIKEDKYIAQFTINGKKHYIGYFSNPIDAHEAVMTKRKNLAV